MSRSLLVASIASKLTWFATLAFDPLNSAVPYTGLVLGFVSLLAVAYHVTDKLLDRVLGLPEALELTQVPRAG